MTDNTNELIPESSIWHSLQQYCNNNPTIKFSSLLESYQKKFAYGNGKDKKNLYKNFKSEWPSQKNKGKYRHFLQLVINLHFVYRIPLEYFKVSYAEVHDKEYTGESKALWLHDEKGKRLTDEPFEKAYLEVCEVPLKKVNESLCLYDYLGKTGTDIKEPNSFDAYFRANTKLYNIIESKLKDIDGFEYIRFLALPFEKSEKLSLKNFDNVKIRDEQAVVELIRFCPLALIIHICKCLKEFPFITDPLSLSGFYVVPIPPRAHHFAILDTDKTFGEYYRCNNRGINRPDVLFLESNSETSKLLYKVYSWEKDKLLGPPDIKTKLDLDSLKKASPEAEKDALKDFTNAQNEFINNPRTRSIKDAAKYAEMDYKAVLEKHEFIKNFK
jgi:hypothetical protein